MILQDNDNCQLEKLILKYIVFLKYLILKPIKMDLISYKC